ncbi:MAG: glycosyltransferase, partial [bacterium]|nr:glycosyltransferase [bacterium]
ENPGVSRWLIALSGALTLVYLGWWLDFRHLGAWFLYVPLFIGELYHVWQSFGYLHTIWEQKKIPEIRPKFFPMVDIFITVCGEPLDVVTRTLEGALGIDYPNFKVHILNDGLVARKKNWEEIADLSKRYPINVITRTTPGGAKAGNVNHALRVTNAPLFALFDADHVPLPQFLNKTVGYLEADPKMAFVQTPQYYANKDRNFLTQAAWEQQELFFGPICQGKNRHNATFWCGTNAVIRRAAVEDIGGVPEDNIAEDFMASLLMHERGWNSLFVPEVLSHGLAPTDLKSYYDQQFRWSRGSQEVLFKFNPLFRRGLTFAQKMQYLYSAGYYLNGFIVAIDAIIPLIVLSTGILPVVDTTSNYSIFFLPFIILTLYILMRSTRFTITFRAIQLTMSSFFIFLTATISVILGTKNAFKVTSKVEQEGNYLIYALPNILYIWLAVLVITLAVVREGVTASVVTNSAWVVFNAVFLSSFIRVAYPWRRAWRNAVSKAREALWFRGVRGAQVVEEKALVYEIRDDHKAST